MSLGSDKGFDDPTDPEQKAVKNGYLAGITFAISAGNNAYFEYALGPKYIEQTLMASTLPTLKTQHE